MTLVQFQNTLPGAKGRSDTATLQAAFPGTPAISGYKDESVAQIMATLHDGVVNGNPDFPNQSLDYAGIDATTAPFVAGDVPTGPGGLPWTAYTPNVVSPGVGSINPLDMGAPPATAPVSSGMGSQNLPGVTASQIANQEKDAGAPGTLVKGHSTSPPIV